MTLGEQTNSTVWFQVLGPLEVLVHGEPIPLGGVKQRSILAALLCNPNRVVSAELVAGELWPSMAADKARASLHVNLSNLRRALAPAAKALGRAELIVTKPPGYRVSLTEANLDLLALEGRLKSAKLALSEGRPGAAADDFEAALALWRGEALGDLADEPLAIRSRVRLRDLRTRAVEGRLESYLASGRHRELVGELIHLVEADPLNERFVELLMLALYRSGRQSEALAVYRKCHQRLDEELGLQPRQDLRELESRILNQDPLLNHVPSDPTPDEISSIPTLLPGSLPQSRGALILNGSRIDLVSRVTTIGRKKDRTILITDALASREHAEIVRDVTGFRLIDRGSSNGTRVNGQLVTEQFLRDGDEVLIGETSLYFGRSTRANQVLSALGIWGRTVDFAPVILTSGTPRR